MVGKARMVEHSGGTSVLGGAIDILTRPGVLIKKRVSRLHALGRYLWALWVNMLALTWRGSCIANLPTEKYEKKKDLQRRTTIRNLYFSSGYRV